MTFIENIFVCMVAPLLLAMLCTGRKNRDVFLFLILGMGACLLSAYINTFFAVQFHVNNINSAIRIAPVVEEIMKLLPVLFYILIFEPKQDRFKYAVYVAVGFATFENVCYLTQNGAAEFNFLLIRGFGTGAMHIVCGGAYGHWIPKVWKKSGLKAISFLGVLCLTISYHALYNFMVSVGGALQIVAYFVPIATVIIGWGAYLYSASAKK